MPKPSDIIGKPVRERYGRFTGRVVTYESNLMGEVTAIVYESNGVLMRSGINSFYFDGKEVEIAPSAIIESRNLHQELSHLLIRLQSLFKLRSNKLISDNAFKRIRNELNSIYKVLSEKALTIMDKLNRRERDLLAKKEWMYGLFMNLEIARRLKWISDEVYIKSYEQMEKELFRTSNEIDDIKRSKIDLEGVLDELSRFIGKHVPAEKPKPVQEKEEARSSPVEGQAQKAFKMEPKEEKRGIIKEKAVSSNP
ncbi:hypothetical protein DRN86_01910 [Candidatus Geothermarchaeota archaeon]|nr:MAG: hypothetical protein DRN86_01910 [Candidatus Geothermarchaeota archaeon]